ncbi:DUF6279 family lipoprotein [Variovorax sp. dw_954]|uniref:DUF6279 family lipoprotein n=1 Tax=Variovorax sp. dw_954 TaxID=2720078 RepID=UPI001BD5E011|nr:DUF6279 family lipoprotein [Variovorax sp. dw_954]
MPAYSLDQCWKLARIIVAVLGCALLGACSSVRLAYNNLPTVTWWWLDGYVDLDATQSPRVREALAQLLEWHRRNELPKFVALLQKAQALAPDTLTPEQVCAFSDEIRDRLLAFAVRAEAPGATLALSLGDAQLQHLQRKYAKVNESWRKDWLALDPEQRQDKRFDQMLDRYEDFYGPLDASQRELLRRLVAASAFSAERMDAQRRLRQQEALALLRGLRADPPSSADTQAALNAYVQRIAYPPPGPWRDYQQALSVEGCRNLAALHNATTASQRERAARRLRDYENDVRQLAAS